MSAAARRTHDKNAAQMVIDSTNSATDTNSASRADSAACVAKNTPPIAAAPSA
jgi:hypothetical protein